jgi:transposase-like protein
LKALICAGTTLAALAFFLSTRLGADEGTWQSLASLKDRKPLRAALKPIYQAATAEAAAAALDAFAQGEWGAKFPTVAAMWQRQWEQVIPFFAYP